MANRSCSAAQGPAFPNLQRATPAPPCASTSPSPTPLLRPRALLLDLTSPGAPMDATDARRRLTQPAIKCRIWTGRSRSAHSRDLRCSPSSPPAAPRVLKPLRSVRIRSTTRVRLLHRFVLLPSEISVKMIISMYTITIIAMLIVLFVSLCLASTTCLSSLPNAMKSP